jgi:O-antigen/teichoic acid export membrane protein
MDSTPDASSIKSLAVRGAVWTVLGFGASNLLRFGSNLILTRLLVPELFGLIGLVYVFISGLHMFSDVGLNVSIIQNKRGDERAFLNTAWTIQVMRGVLLWVICLFLAYPASLIYHEPKLVWLVPIVGLNTIIAGFNCTAIISLNRHLAVKQLALFELSGQLVTVVVTILWAYFSPTVWAMVAGGLASGLYQLMLSHWLGRGEGNWFTWNKSAARELLSFGVWIFISTALTFFAEQADRLILGRLLGFTMLGIYGIALTFADVPRAVTLALNGKVLMPALSKMIDLPRPVIRDKLNRKRKLILAAIVPVVAIMVSFGDFVITTLYDQRYEQAAWMLPILSLGIWPRLLANTNEPVLMALGKPQYNAAANLTRFMSTVLGIWIGYSLFGLVGAVIGVALNDLFCYLAINYGLWKEKLGNIKQDLLATGILLSALMLLIGLRYLLGFGLPIDKLF